ncbi:MAG: hypothetical protein R2755_05830 [Acidimicrobiales bacterium]
MTHSPSSTPPAPFPGWPSVLRTLFAHQDLPRELARACMREVLDGTATPAQIAAFAVALRMKGEAVHELAGLLDAMLDAATLVPLDPRRRWWTPAGRAATAAIRSTSPRWPP